MDKPTMPFHPPDQKEIDALLRESRERRPVVAVNLVMRYMHKSAFAAECGDRIDYHSWIVVKEDGDTIYQQCEKCGSRLADSKKNGFVDTQWLATGIWSERGR